MATVTCSLFDNVAKAVHAGLNYVTGSYNSGAVTASNGDVVFLCKIPNGARIVEVWEDHSTGATAHAISIGLAKGFATGGGASLSIFIAAGAQATKNRWSVVGPAPVISVSDGDALKFGILSAHLAVTGTATTSIFINFGVGYLADGS